MTSPTDQNWITIRISSVWYPAALLSEDLRAEERVNMHRYYLEGKKFMVEKSRMSRPQLLHLAMWSVTWVYIRKIGIRSVCLFLHIGGIIWQRLDGGLEFFFKLLKFRMFKNLILWVSIQGNSVTVLRDVDKQYSVTNTNYANIYLNSTL